MAKRSAAIQINDRNWDAEEESEEAGQFKIAGAAELSQRVIKKAKRRVPEGEVSTNSFKGFQGFGTTEKIGQKTTSTFAGFQGFSKQAEKTEDVSMNVNDSKSDGKNVDVNDVYMTHVKRLNEDVCEWIKKHISQNPYVDLSPVFKDYEKHLSILEKKYRSYSVDHCDNKTMATAVTFPTSISTAASVNSSVFTSTYGSNNLSPATSIPSVSNTTEPEDEPKTQSQIKSSPEEDAFFSLRCKLFFKKTDDWSELGVGMLSLKKISDEKIQVIIRNDTALGKIILNVIINESTPMSRSGKNNVLLLSVPNPPVFGKEGDNSKPVSYLIRVKSAENAEELLTKMKPL